MKKITMRQQSSIRLCKKLDEMRPELVLEMAAAGDEAVNKIYVCYSNFSPCLSKTIAERVCFELNEKGIQTIAVTQNIITLILPDAPSIKLCGTLTPKMIQSFEAIVAASVVRAISVPVA